MVFVTLQRIEVRLVQSRNVLVSIEVTEAGMMTLPVSPEHPLKTLGPINVTPLGMVRLVKPEQLRNEEARIAVTPTGMLSAPLRLTHPWKALDSMSVMVLARFKRPLT